jgi:hypothetical protein
MIDSVTSTKNYSIRFSICTDDKQGLLWIEVITYEANKPRQTKDFAGNKYGKALEYYKRRQAELKAEYGE